MERHDPLGGCGGDPPPIETPPAKPKHSRKQPLLLRQLAEVTDETLAFLCGGPDQRPGDFERNLSGAPELRREFTRFCELNPFYPNWRQAWAVFIAQTELSRPTQVAAQPSPAEPEGTRSERIDSSKEEAHILHVDFAAAVQTHAAHPRAPWQQRLRARMN
jgi:hypothetical protein